MIHYRAPGMTPRGLVPAPQSLTRKQLRERERLDADRARAREQRVLEMRIRLLHVCLPMIRQSRIAARYAAPDRRQAALRAARVGILMVEDCTIFRPMIELDEMEA